MRTLVVALGVAVVGSLVLFAVPQPGAALTKAECEVRYSICVAPCETLGQAEAYHCTRKCQTRRWRCFAKVT